MADSTKEKVIKETRRLEEDVEHSEKNHYVSACFWRNIYMGIGVMNAILAAIAGCSALSDFENHSFYSAMLAVVIMILSGVLAFMSPHEKSHQYKILGDDYNALRNDIRILREVKIDTFVDEKDLIEELEKLKKRKDEINKRNFLIFNKHYKRARKGIEDGEAEYKIDKKDGETK
ncbi:MAG: SLATT domain-containing protein [Candidatus Peribacteraceae bacterium]|nr:SLATT domain-containing protein [Candidatus Peribacteraceae bacterium]